MSRSLYQILSVRTINNGWGYPSHWPVSDGPRWWAMFVSWPHTSNTNNISDPRHSSAADQCGDNWANNEDSEFEWSEKYLMFEQENYLISSGSVVHRTRWSVITCTLCHTFWSHQPVKCADHKIIWSTLFWHDVMDAGGINRNISPLSHQTLLSKSEPLFLLLMLSSPDIVPSDCSQGEPLGSSIKKEDLYFRKWPFTQLC